MKTKEVKDIEVLIKEAQTNIAWAEHRGDFNEKRVWTNKLKELKTKTTSGK